MAHQGNTATLRCCAEECDLNIAILDICGIVLNSCPRSRCDRLLKVFESCQLYVEIRVDLHQSHEADLQQWNVFRAKQPIWR